MAFIKIDKINSLRGTPLLNREIADKAGIEKSYLNKIRLGKHGQTLPVLKKIADALECYPSELLPDSWQRPMKIDDKIIDEITEYILSILIGAEKDKADYTPKQLSNIISIMLKIKY